MKREDAEEFTQALGQIVGGSWRQIALAKRIGVPRALGVSLEDWVEKRLGGYVRMSMADRREAVKELTAEGMSNVAIGEALGVDEGTIRNAKRSEHSEVNDDQASNRAIHGVASSENSEPLSAVAALAAEDELRQAIDRERKKKERMEKRTQKEAETVEQPLPNGTYQVICADPSLAL